MKRILLTLLFVCFASSAGAAPLTPVGNWKTIDDSTQTPRSIVAITEHHGELSAKIKKIFYRRGEGPNDICKVCTGTRHNKNMLGLQILWGMTGQGTHWNGGTILDPENGKMYHARFTLENHGKVLKVRAYIGFPLIGRTQYWQRVG